ncbi:hypothetical protein BdWA1_001552 [Babesia duncani]|uniref:Uncharacterized protein n=1 Tax=Babesia duncani TaxID=323732 RepID=A0AAD9PK18_9APIC|nr:hypothetical protein BdWA1_001552 [Babesia duncani]
MNLLETKITDSEQRSGQLFIKTSERIDAVEKTIVSVGMQQENAINDKILALETLYQKFGEAFATEKENYKRSEREAMVEVNRKINAIKDSINEMQKSKTEVSGHLKKYLDNELPQLKAKLLNVNDQLGSMETVILEKTCSDLMKLASFLKHENSHIDGMHKSISNEIAKGIEKLQGKIHNVLHRAFLINEYNHTRHRGGGAGGLDSNFKRNIFIKIQVPSLHYK